MSDKMEYIYEREYGIDLLKITACFLVVAIHTIDGRLGIINRLFQMITVVAIPVFFCVNGYLLLCKRKALNWHYCAKKISKILFICFMWEFLHSIIYFVIYRKTRNFIVSFLLDFVQKGLFFHFWFMGVLVILYCFMPFLAKLLQEKIKVYQYILVALAIVCVFVDILQFLCKSQFVNAVPQTFRLWMWIFYFMLGGYIFRYKETTIYFNTISKYLTLIIGGAFLTLFAWMWIGRQYAFGKLDVAGFYGALPTILVVTLIMYKAIVFRFKGECVAIITRISGLIMGIYIIHPFVLSLWIHFLPQFEHVGGLNILYCILTFISSGVISAFISHSAFLKEIIKI